MCKLENKWKEIEFLPRTLLSNFYIFGTGSCKPLIFQTINSVRLNSLSLKYQRFTPSGCKYIGIRNAFAVLIPISEEKKTAFLIWM